MKIKSVIFAFKTLLSSRSFRVIASVFGIALGFVLLLQAFASWMRPELPGSVEIDPGSVALGERMRHVEFTDEDRKASVVHREVDYADPDPAWFPKGEPDFIRRLVEAGKLPPVHERVGSEPLVMEGPDGIGNYGGTWFRSSTSDIDRTIIENRMSGARLFRWSPLGEPVMPHLAKRAEHNEDYTEWRIFMREGVRWSDGHPLTAYDMLYYWEEDVLELGYSSPIWMDVQGELGTMNVEDDHTFVLRFAHPYPMLLQRMASGNIVPSPRHYLAQFHPDKGDSERIKREMERRGEITPRALYERLRDPMNPEHPRLWPWIPRSSMDRAPYIFVRNPYFFAVDTQGNQLPYIDQVMFQVRREELIPIAAADGGVTMQARFVRYTDYTLLMEQRDRGNYDVLHWFPATRSNWALFPNLNRRVEDHLPETAMKRDLLRDKRFRQALSLAINRPEIIHANYNNIVDPAQIAPGKSSQYHSPELEQAFIEHDPERANALLDDIGLTNYDREGFRTFPDGSRMTWFIEFTDFSGVGPAQFIIDDWRRVGIRALARERASSLFRLRKMGLQQDFTVWTGESEFEPMIESRSFVPSSPESHHAGAYGLWFRDGGFYGHEDAENRGGVPPEVGSPVWQTMDLLVKAHAATDQDERSAYMDEIFALNAENVWTISLATPLPQPVIKSRNLRNVPENALFGFIFATPSNAGIETFYFEEPHNPPHVISRLEDAMMNVTLSPRLTRFDEGSSGTTGRLIQFLLIGVLLAGTVLVCLRHPYIARRLGWMVPTLLIISVVAFTLIQLPPGSYLDSWIIEQQMSGDDVRMEEVEMIREMFHLDSPMIVQYAHWMGLKWFVSFKPEDKGLLQGDLGRAMSTRRPVSEMIGDRLILTIAISIGTILFTWFMAFPIGVYSAIRQYSFGDYLFTFIGFFGLCVPNFLLALLLMYFSQAYLGVSISGLFSPEYAMQDYWDWGKFLDLLKHLWVPVIVLGTAGTAGMIRIMRANLLDELRKPYVTTARAKGVKPFKLLIKYPVRLALNPFVSGIGGLFPALISGGAIVSIVLSLPTIGPLLLDGLLTQDMYLAGSLLMVLSLLSVFGTLVSDLLLLLLDPRIRMEGGQVK